MTEIAHLPPQDAMQTVREMVVTHLVGLDQDPRETFAEQLIDDLSEALHWDAQDAGSDVDAELADAEDFISQALAEYAQAKAVMEGGGEGDKALVDIYRDLEASAEKAFSTS